MTSPLAIVTGATGGIGSAVVSRLWREGYSLIALGKTPEKVAALEVSYPQRATQRCLGLVVDFRTDTRLPEVTEALRSLGHRCDLLVVCHGVAPRPGPALHAASDLAHVLAVDVAGAFTVCQLAGAHMIRHHTGSIALVSSLHARQTYPARVPYCVAKSAIVGLSKALAVEWGPLGVRTNCILPWQVDGERSQRLIDAAREQGEDLEEAYLQKSPMRRLIHPEEIAETVVWLARTTGVNGADIVLDGGVSASMWYQGFTKKGRQENAE